MKRIWILIHALVAVVPIAHAETSLLLPEAVSGLGIAGEAGSPTVSAATPVGETIYVRARDFASGPVRGNLNYLRFDLSGLSNPSIQEATLTLTRVGNDGLSTGRVALFGLLDVPGNAPQDWDTSSFTAGDELDISMFADFEASVGVSPVNLANVADFSEDESISGNTVTLDSEALVAFLQERADAGGLATLLLAMPSQGAGNDKHILYASHLYAEEALRVNLEIVYFDASLPTPPENLRVSDIHFSANPSVTLEWDSVPGALSYKLFRRAPGEAEGSLLASTSSSLHTDSTVNLLETYYYAVAVVTADGESILSPEIEVEIADDEQDAPPVPSGFVLTASEPSMIGLSWSESTGALLYEVYRSTLPDRGYVLQDVISFSSFLDLDGIEGWQTYYYTVSAIGAGGMSAFSSPFEVGPRFTDEGTLPDAPSNLVVTNRDLYSIELSWDSVAGAEGYYVYRSINPDDGFALVDVVEDNTTVDDYAIYPQHPYFYRVRAVNGAGFSTYSETVEAEENVALYRQMENLDRALVGVAIDNGFYLGWRLLGTDPQDIAFNLYRDGELLNASPITSSTNYIDPDGSADAVYTVRPIVEGLELSPSAPARILANNYLSVPLQVPAGGTTPDDVNYVYSANDASAADLDGDGELEIVLKWDPSNSKDNSQSGYTGNVYLDAYELDGTLLWRIDLGRNIRAGAHYTQFMVYDFDSDGKAELICKTADATVDGVGTVVGDPNADYRNSAGYILDGPEYLTAFDGETGAIIDTVDYVPQRGNVADWGDDYGNRVDRFLAGVAYFDGVRPSYFAARGQYRGQGGTDGRTVIAAFDLVDDQLVQRWVFDSLVEGREYAGQGHHQLSVGDADGDGRDEIMYGGMVVDDDGTGLYSTELGTGDALHFSDFDPTRPGLELFAVKEDTDAPVHVEYRDPATGELIWGWFNGRDTGRGLTADIDPTYPGAEVWGAANVNVWSAQGEVIGDRRPSINFATWWDADLLRELTDGTSVRGWDYVTNSPVELMVADGVAANNGTKSNSSLQADLLGDWREEVVFRTVESDALRIYTTTDLTAHRIPSLMHDPMYRLAVAWQNNGYNQPPHPSFFIGHNMPAAPVPNIFVYPVPVFVGPSENGTFTGALTVVLIVNGSENLHNEYRLDGSEWTSYEGPFDVSDEGEHLVEFRTLDGEGEVLATSTSEFLILLPVPGDLNGDREVDRNDRRIMQDARGSCSGDPDYVPAADLDDDGCVDQDDFKAWTQHFVDYRQATRGEGPR